MNLEDIKNINVLARPLANLKEIADGAYKGYTIHAALEEKEDKFNGGLRVVLNVKVEVSNDEDETVDLYTCANYSWSSRGNMLKLLEKLNCVPEPGGEMSLSELIGIPVQVIVENIEKEGVKYPNIISIKRISDHKVTVKQQLAQKPSKADKKMLEQEISELEMDLEDDDEDQIENDSDDDDENEDDEDDDGEFDLADIED